MPDPSPNEQFQRVLDLADRQITENKILIRFGPNGKLRFVIDEAALEKAITGSDLDSQTFGLIFHNEIGPLLEAVIRKASGQVQIPSSFLAEVATDPIARDKRQRLFQERAQLIENRLFAPELRARYLIKASSKHPRLRSSGWEIAQKLKLSTKEDAVYPYATLSLETLRPEDVGIFAWFLPEIGHSEYLTFDCDEGDLDDLMQLLQDAKSALRDARKGA